MTGLSAGDFTALADFPLLWRWTSPTHAVLPAALATIRPLTALAAAAISHEAVRRCADEVKADDVVEIDAAAGESAVRERLAALDVGATRQALSAGARAWRCSRAGKPSFGTGMRSATRRRTTSRCGRQRPTGRCVTGTSSRSTSDAAKRLSNEPFRQTCARSALPTSRSPTHALGAELWR